MVVRNDGVVLEAHYNCTVGLRESCCHMSADLFGLWEKNNSRYVELRSTTKICKWASPSEDAVKNMECQQGKDIIFNNAQQNKKGNSTKGISVARSFPRLAAAEQALFYHNLSQCHTQDKKLIKLKVLAVFSGYDTSNVPKAVMLDLADALTNLYGKKAGDLNLAELQNRTK